MDHHQDRKQWHVARWPALAWLETLIKLAALSVAYVATYLAITRGTFIRPLGATWVELAILGILSLGLMAAIYDRLSEREIIAMIFVILNNLGHWGLLVALLSEPKPTTALLSFSLLMLAGDLIKLTFIKRHKFEVRDTPRAVLYGLTGLYIAGYMGLILLSTLA